MTRQRTWERSAALLLAGIALAGGASLALAQQPTVPMPIGQTVPAPKFAPKAEPAAEKGKLLGPVEFRNKPWPQVFEWLSDQTGLPYASNFQPSGSFTLISPRTPGKEPLKMSVGQVMDRINDGLLAADKTNKYILIRKRDSLTIFPADEQIPPELVPQVTPDELPDRGNSELVSMLLSLKSLVAEDFAGEAKRLMGPFAEVAPLARTNQLQVQGTAGNLRRLMYLVGQIEEAEGKGQATFSHKCLYVRAKQAEDVLKNLMGDAKQVIETVKSGGQPGGSGNERREPVRTTQVRSTQIAADEASNTIHVTGPADKVALAKTFIAKLDVPPPGGGQPLAVGPPVLQNHEVPAGNADLTVKTLQEVFKTATNVRISAISPTRVMVWAGPEDQMAIAKLIEGTRPTPSGAQLLPLNILEAPKAAESLKAMFGDAKTGAPYIEADVGRNGIIVRGTPEQIKEVKAVLAAIDDAPTLQTGGLRVITLEKGSASTLAEAIQRLLPQMRDNPIKIVIPGSGNGNGAVKPMPTAPRDEKQARDLSPISFQDDEPQLVDPRKKKEKGQGAPVTITAVGNKLIVTSEDPQALALVQELVRLLTQTAANDGDFEVIRLKHANATDAAKIIDEFFNGPKQQGNQGGNRGGFQFPGFGGMQPQQGGGGANTPRVEKVRVVADPATNSLLVKASPLDMLTIRNLINRSLDTGSESEGLAKTYVIALKHASATEIAGVVRDLYREHMNQSAVNQRVGGFPGFGFFGGGFGQQNQNQDRRVMLSIGVDDRTNSLVVNCPPGLYDNIKRLVEELELASSESKQMVKIVPIKGIDPQLVQQAIDAIQGRTPTNRQATGGLGTSTLAPGGFTPGGFTPGGGGFNPGGFQGGGGFNPGGGGNRGGFQGGGGGFNPGGGGGRRGGGGGGRFGGGQSRGPDFFGSRVTDDPQPTVLVDPRDLPAELVKNAADINDTQPQPIQLTAAQEAAQPVPPQAQPVEAKGKDDVNAPRLPVNVEALEELGVIVLRANNPQDLEAALRIIEFIQKVGAGAEVDIQLVPLRFGDATSVTTTLNQLYQRIAVGPNSTTVVPAPRAGVTNVTVGGPGASIGVTSASPGQAQAQPANIVLIPLVRQNAILVAAPKSRLPDITKEITRLDVPIPVQGRTTSFPLKQASASRVASLITSFYASRFSNEGAGQNQIRVTYDEPSNTVFVQAGPADLDEIRALITRIDSTASKAVNDIRIVPLKNAVADDLTTLLTRAIAEGVAPTTPTAPGVFPQIGGGQQGGQGGQQGGGINQGPGTFGQQGAGGQISRAGTIRSLRFLSNRKEAGRPPETGILDDIRINSDPRTNSLVIAAPEKTMELILALIRDLDVAPTARSEINVFSLKKADATQLALTLQQLFLGGGGLGGAGTRTLTGGGLPGGAGGQGLGAPLGAAGPAGVGAGGVGAAGARPLQITLSGVTPQGAPLIDLRLTVDERTNSLVVAGSRNDLDVIEAIVARIDDADVQLRRNEAIRLKYAQAVDVANAVNDFITKSLNVFTKAGQLTTFQELQRDVVIAAEPISNTLLISATPQYFEDIMRLIVQLDYLPPQVMVQVLVAEVDLSGTEEFGVEIGLQSPVLFQRSIFPAVGLTGGSTVITNPTGTTPTGVTLIPQGVTVNSSNPVAQPGFNFNNPALPLGNNPLVNPGIVGLQGLGSLGVGRVSPSQNIGGFVFSAASDSFNLLIRSLRVQSRLDILSRPQIMTLDNQTAYINVGQEVPIVTGSNVTATGVISNNIERRQVGVLLQVTPRITPDGRVLMRVVPEVSSVSPQVVQLGNGVAGTVLNIQHLETTVAAVDGETIALGGLITKRNSRQENKIPWFGDLPGVGALFRYRAQSKAKSELLIILTPHIIRCPADADRIKAEEARRMDWVLGDVLKIHGTPGGPGSGPAVWDQPPDLLKPVPPWSGPPISGLATDACPVVSPTPVNPQTLAVPPPTQPEQLVPPDGTPPAGMPPVAPTVPNVSPAGHAATGLDRPGMLPTFTPPMSPTSGTPSARTPAGTVPTGTVPTGTVPTGTVPTGTVPTGTVSTGTVPTGTIPAGAIPAGQISRIQGWESQVWYAPR